ncbi:arsenite methyltransferase [Bdellovibrionota bacterium FG-2]
MKEKKHDEIRQEVRDQYRKIAENSSCGCAPSCCSPSETPSSEASSQAMGYTTSEVNAVPEGANMGLGCGNPQAIAALKTGETVLDLGSGGGFDCFLAAKQVGETGQVIGVDMTPEMISKARSNAEKASYTNVEFRLGEIENLPVADHSVDVVISNCVINLSPDKPRVFSELYRVLRVGGRLAISDVVANAPIPESIKNNVDLYTGCIAGAVLVSELEQMLHATGFKDVRISPKELSKSFIQKWAPGTEITDYVVSANIEAVK